MTDQEFMVGLKGEAKHYAENLLQQRDEAVARATALQTEAAGLEAKHAKAMSDLRSAMESRLKDADELMATYGGDEVVKKILARRRVKDLDEQMAKLAEARDKEKAEAGE